jgi:hypothetical protein
MGPGAVMLALAADRAVAAVRDPDLTRVSIAVGAVMLLLIGGAWLRRRSERTGSKAQSHRS